MKIIVTGGTGLVGAEVLRQVIHDPAIEEVTAIVRRPLPVDHPKIKTIIHKDFNDYSDFAEVFRKHDACLWCLGISQMQVSKEEYVKITFDYAVSAAKAIQRANPSMAFIFLSGMGADSTEKSKTLFARIKGKTENALIALGMRKLFILRPGGIRPVHRNPNSPFLYRLMEPLYPLMELIMPASVISSVQVARAMLHIAKEGVPQVILENPYLRQLAGKS